VTIYCKVMLGAGNANAAECFAGGYIGANFDITQDLTNALPDDWTKFNQKFIPVWLAKNPGKTRVAAGLYCGALWTIAKQFQNGDVMLSADGTGNYRIGEVVGEYQYVPDAALPHRRPVHWRDAKISRSAMSDGLKGSIASGIYSDVSTWAEEIEALVSGEVKLPIVSTDATIEDPATFALEKHLEDFLVQNWAQTELGKDYVLFEEEGQKVGQQYPTDTGRIDILAIRKDKKQLLVVELKRGRASDVVVGQVLRYMGYVVDTLAGEDQTVRGVIIALDDDTGLRRALAVAPNVSFYRYSVSFKLFKG